MILAAVDPRLSKFLDNAANHPVLSASEQRALIALAKGGNLAARRRLCTCNLKFVIQVASKYRYSGVPMADLIHEGVRGLDNAIDRYSPESGFRFISYAVWWIRQAIAAAISTTSRTIRITAEHEAPIRKMRSQPLRQAIGGDYVEDVEAAAKKAKIAPRNLIASLLATHPSLRINLPSAEDGAPLESAIPSDTPQPDALIQASERRAIVNRLRGKLPEIHRRIITLAFGLEDRPPMTLRDIGIQLGLSHERIRQLRNEALAMMRALAVKYRD